jgi:hypothetical protein
MGISIRGATRQARWYRPLERKVQMLDRNVAAQRQLLDPVLTENP